MQEEQVILVDEQDNELGTMNKLEAHQKGLLHRAFSVFVFNDQNELMLQQRAQHKYHSGGLWTNTCCSHPRPNEVLDTGIHRRLMEEMGFDCDIHYAFKFLYKAELDRGLTEHELDHVFIGHYDGTPKLNPEEACDWKYMSIEAIEQEMQEVPERYTEWFKIILKQHRNKFLTIKA
ncbi:isopentenyl-diphosphate Delta-isomerase [uncultured Microscilla sp.]|uniref:isopentenyl-diphosphate Delta-isomerase n=1 Tax=uncultured Microscilla sp. TaxID=432653 RepID=UPI002635812D|nr:isopentenyl-diphosphate Delta-isomerase [uncultured Microscilla sp.]